VPVENELAFPRLLLQTRRITSSDQTTTAHHGSKEEGSGIGAVEYCCVALTTPWPRLWLLCQSEVGRLFRRSITLGK
jgi:hypothetical protein